MHGGTISQPAHEKANSTAFKKSTAILCPRSSPGLISALDEIRDIYRDIHFVIMVILKSRMEDIKAFEFVASSQRI